jgi:HK97 family phage portal protein
MSMVSQVFDRSREGALARMRLRSMGSAVSVALTEAWRTNPRATPNAPTATITTQDRGRVGLPNARLFRNWAEHGEWVRSAINIRRDQVAQAEWVVEGKDPTMAWDKGVAKEITELLTYPNPVDEMWKTFIQQVVEDVLVLDAGAIEKERTLRGGIAYLHVVDGASIRVNRFWEGDPDEPRYFWYPDYQERARLANDDLIYLRSNPMSYRVVGLAPLETLRLAVDAELGGQGYNTRQLLSPAPDGILDLGEQARSDQIEDFKAYWNTEVAGKGAMAFLGGTKGAKFMPFRLGNREMQFLEFQMYLTRKIAAVFGMSIQDLGVPLDTNRATAGVQSENTEDRGLRPLLELVSSYINKGVVHDKSFGGRTNNLTFKFAALNLRESLNRAQRNRYALGGMPWTMIDEARKEDGRPPIGGTLGSSLLVMGPKGPVLLTEGEIPTATEALESGNKQPALPSGTSAWSNPLLEGEE